MFSWSGFNKRFYRAIVDAAAHRKPRFGSTYECRWGAGLIIFNGDVTDMTIESACRAQEMGKRRRTPMHNTRTGIDRIPKFEHRA